MSRPDIKAAADKICEQVKEMARGGNRDAVERVEFEAEVLRDALDAVLYRLQETRAYFED